MGYKNTFSLKIRGESKRPALICPNCNTEKNPGKFCNECGQQLVIEEVNMKPSEIISELRRLSDDCAYLLTDEGRPNESGSGYQIEEDIQKFSQKYPDLIFQLHCDWDSGFGDVPSIYYFKNGKKQNTKAKVIYDEPEF
jgi:hypothetical protein